MPEALLQVAMLYGLVAGSANIATSRAFKCLSMMLQEHERGVTPAISIPAHATPDKLCMDLTDQLGRIGDGRRDAEAPGSSWWSEAGSHFAAGKSPEIDACSAADAVVPRASTRPALAPLGGGSNLASSNLNAVSDSFMQSTSLESVWGGRSMWSGGVLMDTAPEDTGFGAGAEPSYAARGASSHLSEHSAANGATWAPAGGPAGTCLHQSSDSEILTLGGRCDTAQSFV